MSYKNPFLLWLALISTFLFTAPQGQSVEFNQRLDSQFRFDDRSNRDFRTQYRFRYRAALHTSALPEWSMHSFVITGDRFSNSHNTFDSGNTDRLYIRRLFIRRALANGKVEAGVIPTYKGRVSSSGLSSHGWIKGIRGVTTLGGNDAIELVVGQLDDIQAKRALRLPTHLNYAELEYSANMGEKTSFEISLEYMTNHSYLRGEYRWKRDDHHTFFVEGIRQNGSSSTKVVAGASGEWYVDNYPIEYFSHYSYVSSAFGPRAELTEDFLGTGHGFSAEFSGAIPRVGRLKWFVRYDVADSVSRLLAGFKIPLIK